MRRSLALLAVLWASGCYLHHQREEVVPPSGDAMVDAVVDATIDAALDASVDAPTDALADAALCETVTLAPQPITAPVDIVWAIDSSMSMQDERARLQATINDFARRVRQRVTDLHVVVITADNIVPPPLGTDPDSYLFVPQMIASNDTLTALLDMFPTYAGFLRPDALLHFVVVSDDDSTLSADRFRLNADRIFGKPYKVHAIASPDVDGQPCRSAVPSPLCVQTGIQAVCGAAAVGVEYYRAAETSGGLSIDVCLDDWSQVLGPLSDAVVGAEPIPCRSQLQLHESGRTAQTIDARLLVSGVNAQPLVQVNDRAACGNRLAFYRESANANDDTFVLCPVTCDQATRTGASIEIDLDCANTN